VRRCGVHLEGVNWSRGISFYYDGQRGERGEEESRPPSGGFARVRHEQLSAKSGPPFPVFCAYAHALYVTRPPLFPSPVHPPSPARSPRAFAALFPLAAARGCCGRAETPSLGMPRQTVPKHATLSLSLSLSPCISSVSRLPRRNLVRSRAQWFSASFAVTEHRGRVRRRPRES